MGEPVAGADDKGREGVPGVERGGVLPGPVIERCVAERRCGGAWCGGITHPRLHHLELDVYLAVGDRHERFLDHGVQPFFQPLGGGG